MYIYLSLTKVDWSSVRNGVSGKVKDRGEGGKEGLVEDLSEKV